MIIFSGWGLAAFLPAALVFAIVDNTIGMDTAGGALAFGVLGGASTYAAGWFMNIYWPRLQAIEYRRSRYESIIKELETLGLSTSLGTVEGETPGNRLIRLEKFLDEERETAFKELRNRNKLFFLPAQWWGIIVLAAGLFAAITGPATSGSPEVPAW